MYRNACRFFSKKAAGVVVKPAADITVRKAANAAEFWKKAERMLAEATPVGIGPVSPQPVKPASAKVIKPTAKSLAK